MNPYLLLCCFVMLLGSGSSAQQVIKTKNAYKHLHEIVFIYDTVYRCTYSRDVVQTIYLGANEDFKRVVVKVKPSVGKVFGKASLNYLYVSGRLKGSKESPYIEATNISQVFHESIPLPLK